jgi:hypothetical protein
MIYQVEMIPTTIFKKIKASAWMMEWQLHLCISIQLPESYWMIYNKASLHKCFKEIGGKNIYKKCNEIIHV